MISLSEYIALEVNGEAVSLQEVLRSAKWRGQLTFIQDAANTTLIRQAAERRGIEVSDDELQRAADDFRAAHGLHDVQATEGWLAAKHLSFEDWELLLEDEIIIRKLREMLTGGKVEQHFAENRLSFDVATISHILVSDEDVAKELRAQIAEEEADFYALARRYSVDATTKPAGGYAGAVRRVEMEAAVEAAVFGAGRGKVVGPIKTDEGWRLIKIEALHPATLDNTTREAIKSRLFDEWLKEQRRKAQIGVPLLTESRNLEESECSAEVRGLAE